MSTMQEFLGLSNLGHKLVGEQQSSFYELFGVISWLALLMFALWSLSWTPPVRNIISSIRKDIYSERSKSDIVRDLIPNFQRRCRCYKIMAWGMVATMFACYLMSFCYGSYAITALISDMQGNKFSAFFILAGLSGFMFFAGHYFMREAHRLATFLQQVIF